MEPETTDTGATAPATATINGPVGNPPTTEPAKPQEGAEGESKTFDAEYVTKLRRENADARTRAKAAEDRAASQLDAIAQALGLKGDEKPDPEKLTAQLTAEQTKAREAAVQLAVYRNASTAGANPDALLDSASFLRSVADVDPNDSTAVADAIKAAVTSNPRLGASDFSTAGQAGLGVAGTSGTPTDPRAADIAQIERDLGARRR